MLATPLITPFRGTMTEPATSHTEPRWLNLSQAARRLGDMNVSYLGRLLPRMTEEGVTVLRPTNRVILIDEAHLVAWWKTWHPDWTDPQG